MPQRFYRRHCPREAELSYWLSHSQSVISSANKCWLPTFSNHNILVPLSAIVVLTQSCYWCQISSHCFWSAAFLTTLESVPPPWLTAHLLREPVSPAAWPHSGSTARKGTSAWPLTSCSLPLKLSASLGIQDRAGRLSSHAICHKPHPEKSQLISGVPGNRVTGKLEALPHRSHQSSLLVPHAGTLPSHREALNRCQEFYLV